MKLAQGSLKLRFKKHCAHEHVHFLQMSWKLRGLDAQHLSVQSPPSFPQQRLQISPCFFIFPLRKQKREKVVLIAKKKKKKGVMNHKGTEFKNVIKEIHKKKSFE
ncbi:hypothetical protein Tc00.1047053511697.30 [Trypanosoma cruzi]|uniref:Uncharacterized protein n=1 Tax=Trypanosoma cruzi (strain CL Brener) TaxID=353153 RepID=Q4D700_TRYCC|nr:hypothetical protein Tc00.1047053511697.30 [Trypanosoma cruzi]EAN88302.1 hypothetical protein Tc00.1047053511697.30 [Trypanosoma cruzi]|eukprot:XP_810153.1 hypothetical protein [Trypanosoma cruzi strain CL Brener]